MGLINKGSGWKVCENSRYLFERYLLLESSTDTYNINDKKFLP